MSTGRSTWRWTVRSRRGCRPTSRWPRKRCAWSPHASSTTAPDPPRLAPWHGLKPVDALLRGQDSADARELLAEGDVDHAGGAERRRGHHHARVLLDALADDGCLRAERVRAHRLEHGVRRGT